MTKTQKSDHFASTHRTFKEIEIAYEKYIKLSTSRPRDWDKTGCTLDDFYRELDAYKRKVQLLRFRLHLQQVSDFVNARHGFTVEDYYWIARRCDTALHA